MIDFREARLRSNPRFQLIPHDRLDTPELSRFRSLSEDPDFFGILLPGSDSKLPAKSVSRDAALLLLALREPACLPNLLLSLFGSDAHAHDRVRQLVLDSVLEVELDGGFISGAAALEHLGDRRAARPDSRIAQLSWAAVDYAAAMESLDAREVGSRLYLFNAAPSTPALQRRFGTDDQVLEFLCSSGAAARRLGSDWCCQAVADPWLVWTREQIAAAAPYKLYVSPTLADLPGVFAGAVESFAKAHCKQFKLGRGAYGLLRPDKLVAFFLNLDQLLCAAESIRQRSRGASAQGVPFTATIDPEGLLSWGMDPPRLAAMQSGREVQSWRQWLTERIAVYAAAGRQAGSDVQGFVRERIALDGVDASNWNPDLAIWRESEAV